MYRILATIFLCFAAVLWYQRSRKNNLAKPPGPPPLPFIGNLLDIPRKREVLAYNEMADKYGEHSRAT